MAKLKDMFVIREAVDGGSIGGDDRADSFSPDTGEFGGDDVPSLQRMIDALQYGIKDLKSGNTPPDKVASYLTNAMVELNIALKRMNKRAGI